MRWVRTKILLILVFSWGLWLNANAVAAAADEAIQVTVSPANAYVQIGGGEESFIEYTLENFSTHTLKVRLEAQSFQPAGEDGAPTLLGRLDFPSELTLYQATAEPVLAVTLLPRSQKKVFVRVAPPLGVPTQEYPMTLFFVVAEATSVPAGQTEFDLNLGSNLIVLTDKSNLDQSALSVVAPSIPSLIDSFLGSPPIKIRVRNDGAAGTLINGSVQLKRLDGTVVESWDFYPDLVLGHQTRQARGKVVAEQGATTDLITDFVLPRPLFGQYQLTAQVVSGHPEATLETAAFEIDFLACPYLAFGGFLLLIVLGGMLQYWRHKKSVARKIRQKNARAKKQRRYFS
jgi:hypothetical protein